MGVRVKVIGIGLSLALVELELLDLCHSNKVAPKRVRETSTCVLPDLPPLWHSTSIIS